MIKKSYFVLIFICYLSSFYAQEVKSIKDKDTIYFYFKDSEKTYKTISIVKSKKDSTYTFKEKKDKAYFKYEKFIELARVRNTSLDIKIISKQFLRKNKYAIIYAKDLECGLLKKILDLELKIEEKVIYVIDEEEKKGKTYLAKETALTMGGKSIGFNKTKNNTKNYKSLKGKDTVYFYFDYSKQLDKKVNSIHSITKDTTYFYTFKENNPNERIQRRFNLIKSKYHTFSDMDFDKQANIKTVTKCFLRKNKDIVIYPKDLDGNKMEKVINSRNLKTIIYIIDIKEKKGKEFIAREVRFNERSF